MLFIHETISDKIFFTDIFNIRSKTFSSHRTFYSDVKVRQKLGLANETGCDDEDFNCLDISTKLCHPLCQCERCCEVQKVKPDYF